MKLKVLIISYDFFPDNSPNTYRWLNVLKEWKESKNIEIFVVSAQKDNFKEYEEFNGINIYRTENLLLKKIKNKFHKSTQKPTVINTSQQDVNEGKGIIRIVHDLTWKKLYFPDFAFLWQKAAFGIAEKLIKENDIYNVVTVSWPFSDHVVGNRLKKKFNINWIADTIDPFYLSAAVNNKMIYKELNRMYENNILKDADSITLLTDKLKNKYSEIYPSLSSKIAVNNNVFVPYEKSKTIEIVKGTKITLVFVGTLSRITRSPENLLMIFNNLVKLNGENNNIELHLYGNLESCNSDFSKYDFLIGKSLFLHSYTKREEIAKILQNASAVVNIGNKNMYQEPSKIVEYVYLKKKILNICSVYDDTAKEMLSSYPLHLNLFPDDCNNNQKLKETLSFINNSINVEDYLIDSIVDKYLLSSVEKKYFELLKTDNE